MSRVRRASALLVAVLAAGSRPAAAQAGADSTITVRLITIGPGREVWERFGHNAIWIHDGAAGTDIAYDYGRFSFETEHFLLRFIQGDMRYWMGQADAQALVEFYGRRNRTVIVQELALSVEARRALRDFLLWNIRPDNKYYQYDYYRDNCSTRVRDALDRVLSGRLHAIAADTVPGASFRFHTDRLIAPLLWAYVGTKAGLGARTDLPVPRWDEMFVPMKLREILREVSIPDGDGGGTHPVVVAEDTVYRTTDAPARTTPPSWALWFALVGIAGAAILLLLARVMRAGFGVVAVSITLALGVGGLTLVGLWFFTSHIMTTANQNVLQINPLSLLVAILLPWGLRARDSAVFRTLTGLAVLVAAGSLIGLLLKALPVAAQANGPIIGLLLPIHLALPVAIFLAVKRRRPERAA